jgi:hypothetical protein
MSPVSSDRMPAGELFLPAYRYKEPTGSALLLVWCPWCKGVHSHGDTGSAIERRGPHCWVASPPRPKSYALVPVSRVTSTRHIPRSSVAETIALSRILAAGAKCMLAETR